MSREKKANDFRKRLAPAMKRMRKNKVYELSKDTLDKMRTIVAADEILDGEI